MASKVPTFADFGKTCAEVLYGGRSGGVYQFDNKCKISCKAADGLAIDVTAASAGAGGALDMSVKGTGKCCKAFAFEGVATSGGKATLKATLSNVLDPGFKAVASAAYPFKAPPKVSVEYGHCHGHVKATVSATKTPELGLAASAGMCGAAVGGEVAYDTSAGQLSAWSVAAGYTSPGNKHSAFAHLLKKGQDLKLTYACLIGDKYAAGIELVKPLAGGGAASGAVGFSRMLESGALAKGRVSDKGVCALLWESSLTGGGKVGLSGEIDAKSLEKNARFGCSVELGK